MITKILSIAFATLIATTGYAAGSEPPKEKVVCIDKTTKDGKPVLDKAGKQVQECRKMKIHKKLEGTEVPPKK